MQHAEVFLPKNQRLLRSFGSRTHRGGMAKALIGLQVLAASIMILMYIQLSTPCKGQGTLQFAQGLADAH